MSVSVVVSGGFDPIHNGHIRLFKEAKELGDELIVIVNNDNWLKTKKGYVFMPEESRVEVVESIKYVDKVYLTEHFENDLDLSVCDSIREVNPTIFANGGDRFEDNIPEFSLCEELGIRLEFNVGGEKISSSSDLVEWSKEKLISN